VRASVNVSEFHGSPTFAKHRIQIENTSELLPLVQSTIDLCMGTLVVDEEERNSIFASERRRILGWLHERLQPQFEVPIEVSEGSASHHGKILARFAGVEEPAKFWNRHYTTFHIDHKQNTAELDAGIQVNVWVNLTAKPISDFNLGFLEKAGQIIPGQQLNILKDEDFADVVVRYQPYLTNEHALIFQSTGAMSVIHGCFRFEDAGQLTNEPRHSIEWRFLVRRAQPISS